MWFTFKKLVVWNSSYKIMLTGSWRIMTDIHEACVKYGTEEDGYVNNVKGANIAGFIKVAEAMISQGLV